MRPVVLDLSTVPKAARPDRTHAWLTACDVAGITGAVSETADPGGALLTVSADPDTTGPATIPFDPSWDQARPAPGFPGWKTARDQGRHAAIDLVGLAAYFLAQREEAAGTGAARHTFGLDDCADPDAYRVPWTGLLANWIVARADEAAHEQGVPAVRIRPWPRGDHALCVTSDADEIRWSWRRWLLMAATRPWRLTGKNAYWNVPEMATRLQATGLHGTFFVGFRGGRPHDIQYDADDVAETLRRLCAAGHEVGLHGSLGTARDATRLAAERERLGTLLGQPVTSTRQHFLDFDAARTWPTQEHAGFQVDSTAQVRGLNGFKHGTCHPFPVPGTDLMEVPPVAMDSYLLPKGRDESEAWDELERLWARTRAVGGAFVINWHNEWYHPRDHPRHFHLLHRVLDTMGGTAYSDTVGGLADWWRRRRGLLATLGDRGVSLTHTDGMHAGLELLGPWDADAIQVDGSARWQVSTGVSGHPVVTLADCGPTVAVRQTG